MKKECTVFSSGGIAESFYAMYSVPAEDFLSEAKALLEKYHELSRGTVPAALRFHVSDINNQEPLLRQLVGPCPAIVGQPPVNGSRIALEACHLSGSDIQSVINDTCTEIRLKNYQLLFYHASRLQQQGSGPQMTEEFKQIGSVLQAKGGTLEKNLQRTWIYCRDIDNNYAGLVKARREFFQQCGLTEKTHYIASTGIEGLSNPYDRLVRMDSFALFGHQQEQIEYMQALDHLSPTHLYGVTFERATRILYGDRSHYYISGTASIDAAGQIVHPGNVGRQTERLIENVEALLQNHGGTLANLKTAVIYLRDMSDASIVEAVLQERLNTETVRIMVKAPVCRPGWLVEMEGFAVNSAGNPSFKAFA